ncbi:MAG: DUF3795 domain-containing protein [Candidatus Bipolaricaulota bacterium]|nr:MAG: DUF3795 domain-containing protein [Candidatus Bipolaricaulota bacterium]
MDREAFRNVRSQIGACGIWCGSCAVGNGSLREAGARYRRVLESHGIEEWAPRELDYEQLVRGLSIVSEVATCEGCCNGGGRGHCELRRCASTRGVGRCSSCDETSCLYMRVLDHMRTGAREAGLYVKMEACPDGPWIEENLKSLAKQFPSCLLFLDTSSSEERLDH